MLWYLVMFSIGLVDNNYGKSGLASLVYFSLLLFLQQWPYSLAFNRDISASLTSCVHLPGLSLPTRGNRVLPLAYLYDSLLYVANIYTHKYSNT